MSAISSSPSSAANEAAEASKRTDCSQTKQQSSKDIPEAGSTALSPAIEPASLHEGPQPTAQQAKKIASLEARITKVESQIRETEARQKEIDGQLKTTDHPQAVVSAHIKLLHDYNEIRDVGQGLMGIIADQRGVRVVDVYRDFEVAEGD